MSRKFGQFQHTFVQAVPLWVQGADTMSRKFGQFHQHTFVQAVPLWVQGADMSRKFGHQEQIVREWVPRALRQQIRATGFWCQGSSWVDERPVGGVKPGPRW